MLVQAVSYISIANIDPVEVGVQYRDISERAAALLASKGENFSGSTSVEELRTR